MAKHGGARPSSLGMQTWVSVVKKWFVMSVMAGGSVNDSSNFLINWALARRVLFCLSTGQLSVSLIVSA